MILKATENNISEGMIFIEKTLREQKTDKKSLAKTLLLCEELLVQMIYHADSSERDISIDISRQKKRPSIKISCKGERFDLTETGAVNSIIDLHDVNDDDEQLSIISNMILRSQAESISLKYSHGINKAYVKVGGEAGSSNNIILFMILGIVVGLLFRFILPGAVTEFLATNVFSVVQDLFMNSIQMIVGPLVFFSIAESMMGFSDYSTFGRIGAKVIGMYFFTTIVAMAVAYAVFIVMKPGDPSQASAVMEMIGTASKQTVAEVSVKDSIIGIIPSNLFGAFAENDMLAIIFIGIFIGIVTGLLGERTGRVQTFIKDGNALFSKMTTIITKVMPLAVFCIMANIMSSIGVESVLSLIKVSVAVLIGLVLMVIFYMAFIAVTSGLNPFTFFRKYKDAALMAFTTASSNATMPVSMNCLDNIGVSKKIYTFSVPLGATINMDGASLYYVIITLFMARIFDIQLDAGLLVSLFLSVLLLSLGTPGIPGAGIACTALLFSQIGVVPEAVGYVMVIDTLTDFFVTASNVIGDGVVTIVAAKSEKLLDIEKYNR